MGRQTRQIGANREVGKRRRQTAVNRHPHASLPPEASSIARLRTKAATVTDSRSMGGADVQAGAPGERCKVGLWNLTGRDVTIRIDGQTRVLAKDRAVTLDLDRAFVWQLDQGETVSERVPEAQPFH